jgi:hypothetical protein
VLILVDKGNFRHTLSVLFTNGDMSQFWKQVWKCDRENCGYIWLGAGDKEPKRCAKCKSPNWNLKKGDPNAVEGDLSDPIVKEVLREDPETPVPDSPVKRPMVGESREEFERDRNAGGGPEHDPKECRLYACGRCKVAGHKAANRGL